MAPNPSTVPHLSADHRQTRQQHRHLALIVAVACTLGTITACQPDEETKAIVYRVRNDTDVALNYLWQTDPKATVETTPGIKPNDPHSTYDVTGTKGGLKRPLPDCRRWRVTEASGLERDDFTVECNQKKRLIIVRPRKPTDPASIYPPPPQPLTAHTITVVNKTTTEVGNVGLIIEVGGISHYFPLKPGQPPVTMQTYYPRADRLPELRDQAGKHVGDPGLSARGEVCFDQPIVVDGRLPG